MALVVMGVLTLTLIAVGCKSNVGSVLSTTIRKVFLPISVTLPTAKFAITTDTGILTYKTIQATAHDNDTVTIVATDVAGNEAEQPII
jgi:hypothetical protein